MRFDPRGVGNNFHQGGNLQGGTNPDGSGNWAEDFESDFGSNSGLAQGWGQNFVEKPGPGLGHNQGRYFGGKTEDGQLGTQDLGIRIGHNPVVVHKRYFEGKVGHGPVHSQNWAMEPEMSWACDQAHFAGAKTERDHDDRFEAKTEMGWTGVPAEEFQRGRACDQACFAGAKTERAHDDHFEAKTEQGWHADYFGHIRACALEDYFGLKFGLSQVGVQENFGEAPGQGGGVGITPVSC